MSKRLLTLLLALGLIVGGIGLSYTPVNAQGEDPPPPTEEVVPPEGSVTGTLTQTVTSTQTVTTEPSEEASEEPTAEPTEEVTPEPTSEPTEEVIAEPTSEPTEEVTPEPTAEPTEEVTPEPTAVPTEEATEEPTAVPTEVVTEEPTAEPTEVVTEQPTEEPTAVPTEEPTAEPVTTTIEPGTAAVVNPPAQTSHVLLQNTSNNTADVSVTVYDTTGASIFSDSFQLAGKGARTLHASAGTSSAGHLYMNLSASQSGMVVQSTEQLVATNVNFGSPTAHNIYEGLNSGSTATDILVPSIHWRDGQWSLVSVQNAGSAPANVQITYFRQDGSQIGSTITVTGLGVGVPHYRNAHTDVSIASEPSGVGSMRVTSTNGQPVAVAVIETLFSYTYSYVGIPVSAADASWSFPSVHRNLAGQFSHILVQNTSTTQAAVCTLTYYDQGGTQVNQFSGINIPAKGALTFHTTNDNSSDGNNYTPTSLGNVGAATVVCSGANVVATVVEAVGAAPYAYNGFNSSGGATTVLLPSVHHNPAGQFSHTLVQNTTGQSNHIQITYYNQDGSVANSYAPTLAGNGSITFHTTNDNSSDGNNYTPSNLGNVGSAEVTSLDSRDVVVVVVETVTGLPGAYDGFK
jgi:hypothetical protein